MKNKRIDEDDNSLIPSEKIEPIIVKSSLVFPKYLDLVSEFYEPTWFKDKDLGKIVHTLVRYYQKKSKVPNAPTMEMMLAAQYRDQNYQELIAKYKTISSIELDYDPEFLDEQILNYYTNMGVYNTIISSVETIENRNSVKSCVEKMTKILSMNLDNDFGHDYVEKIDEHILELSNPEARISTGWPAMDHVLGGGFYRDGRCIVVFMGETHIGKSLFLSNIAANMMKQNKFVIIVSLEMSELVYSTRIDAHITKADVNQINFNLPQLKTSVLKLKEDNPSVKLIVKEFPPSTINCNMLKSYLDKVIKSVGRKPDAVFIDYINLIEPNSTAAGDGTYIKIGNVTKQLRSLSYQFNVPIISATQCNRNGSNNTDIKLTDVAESYALPAHCDTVFGIFQHDGDRDSGIINLTTLKNRLGGKIGKTLSFSIDYSNLIISEDADRSNAEDPEMDGTKIMQELNDLRDL